MADEPRRLSALLGSGRLSELTREAERRRKETAEVKRALPAAEAAHVVSATTNDTGELVLVMDTPVWAARARYCLGALGNRVVRVRVLPRGGFGPGG
jgi:hypothetical protein